MVLEDLSDEDLLDAYLEGREAAFDLLMRRHEDRVFTLALRMLGNRPDALEATQDAFVAVFRRSSSFRKESSFGTWLYRVAANSCIDFLRSRRRLPEPRSDPEPGESAPPVDQAVVDRMVVARALASLPDEYATVVVLHDLGGAPYEEISQLEEIPLGTVKSRISRGRRMLAEALEHEGSFSSSKERR